MAEMNMEKGIISEEALEEVAGGAGVDKKKLKKVLLGAGIAVTSLAAGGVAGGVSGFAGAKLFNKKKAGSLGVQGVKKDQQGQQINEDEDEDEDE